jgi:hypothetical protein
LPPRLVGVVLELIRRGHPQPVRDPHPGRHLAILIGGDSLDGGRADVNADRGGFG